MDTNGAGRDAFALELADLLDLPATVSTESQTSLFDDWGIDSLQAFQMIVIIESMTDTLVPPDTLPELYTVGDAHDYYRSLRAKNRTAE